MSKQQTLNFNDINVDFLKLISEFLSINYFFHLPLINKRMSSLIYKIYDNKKSQENFSDLLMRLLLWNKPMFLVVLKKLILNGIITSNHIIFDESLIAHVVKDNNLDAVTFLLDKKAEVKEAKIEKGGNLLELAIQSGFPAITKKLSPYYNHEIPPQIRSTSKNHTILMQLIAEGETNIDWIKELLPTHLKENNDHELLALAVLNKSYQLTKLLLDNKVKICDDSNKSPLKIYINECDRTSYNHSDGSSITQDYKSINNMVSLLINYGDKIDNIDAEYIKRIFCNDEPVLARVIISHKGSTANINIFHILVRLPKMVRYLEEALDPATLIFWLDHLARKLSKDKNQFQQSLESDEKSYSWLPFYDLHGKEFSLTDSLEQLWTNFTRIIDYKNEFESNEFKGNEGWSQMVKFADELTQSTKHYLMASYQTKIPRVAYNSDEDDDEKPSGSSNQISGNSFGFVNSEVSSALTEESNIVNSNMNLN